MSIPHAQPIVTALSNPQVDRLFKDLGARTTISFSKSANDSWTCMTVGGQTTIEFSNCKHPAEALAHELLHTELKLSGYRQYTTHAAKYPCGNRQLINHVLPMLDNELQHTRMATRFEELGLDLRWFYDDADVHAFKKVRRAIDRFREAVHITTFFSQYVTLLSPGGPQPDLERAQAKAFALNRATPRIRDKLKNIESEFAAWRSADSLEVSPYLARILEHLDLGCDIWVGYDNTFPDHGFFVGPTFDPQDAHSG